MGLSFEFIPPALLCRDYPKNKPAPISANKGCQLNVGEKIGFLKQGKATGVTMVKKPGF